MKNIVEDISPTIIALCETKLGKSSKVRKVLPGYQLFPRNVKLGKGGLLIGIRSNTFRSSLDVTSTEDQNIMTVRMAVSEKLAYRMILAYGPQETETPEVRENFMTAVSVEVQNCKDNSEIPIILGDFNAKVERMNDELVPMSGNGKLLCELVEEQEVSIMNFSGVCQGKWTHEIRTTGAKSVLDYVIASSTFTRSIKSMIIDEDCAYCPFGIRKERGKEPEEVYSDHNAIIIEAVIDVPRRSPQEKQFSWRLQDEGKVRLKEMTSLDGYVRPRRSGNPQEQYDVFESEVNRLLKSTALCIKVKTKPSHSQKCPNRFLGVYKLLSRFGATGKIQRGVAAIYNKKMIMNRRLKEVRKERAECLKESITSLTVNGRFSRQQFWKVRKSVYRRFESCSSVLNEKGIEVNCKYLKELYKKLELSTLFTQFV